MKIQKILLILLGLLTIIPLHIVYLLDANPNIIGFVLIGFLFGFGVLCGAENFKNPTIKNWLNKKITWDIQIKK